MGPGLRFLPRVRLKRLDQGGRLEVYFRAIDPDTFQAYSAQLRCKTSDVTQTSPPNLPATDRFLVSGEKITQQDATFADVHINASGETVHATGLTFEASDSAEFKELAIKGEQVVRAVMSELEGRVISKTALWSVFLHLIKLWGSRTSSYRVTGPYNMPQPEADDPEALLQEDFAETFMLVTTE